MVGSEREGQIWRLTAANQYTRVLPSWRVSSPCAIGFLYCVLILFSSVNIYKSENITDVNFETMGSSSGCHLETPVLLSDFILPSFGPDLD